MISSSNDDINIGENYDFDIMKINFQVENKVIEETCLPVQKAVTCVDKKTLTLKF